MKKIWLDLELRKDIDDYITLIYALETNRDISEISIHNPSPLEILLVNKTLDKFNKKIPFIISGVISEYEEDIHPILKDFILGETNLNCTSLNNYLQETNVNDRIIFCGGSLYTLSKIIETNKSVSTYIQGGYAGPSIVGEKNTLKKFRKREKVPTWNLNLDLEASDKVIASNIKKNFISKNVCHDSWVSISDLNDTSNFFNEILKKYFEFNKRDKCMHDLLAFLSIFDESIIKFKKVNLKRTNDIRAKWFSEINHNSNTQISIELNKEKFKQIIFNYPNL